MLGFSILESLFINILETKFVKEVYHSVLMKSLPEGGVKPAAPVADRFIYVGLDDSAGFNCYCRQTGSADVLSVEKLGACNNKKYRLNVPHKIVFYSSNEKRGHDDITARLLKAVIKTNFINLQKVTVIPDDILRSEAPTGRFKFQENTFYIAIDFFVLLDIITDNCEDEIKCNGVPNPYCI